MYYKNHFIKKKLSQVFLKNQNIINTIIKIIDIKKNQKIIEIGPGLGALTNQITDIVDDLIVIEQDSNLSYRLFQTLNKKNLKIINQDVMKTDFLKFIQKKNQKIRLIGNLPYHISTKLIIYLFKYINITHDMHFMLQKEVARRLLADTNNKEYGNLSVITQYHYKIIPLLNIPINAFIPKPKVESMMIQLLPHKISPYPVVDIKKLSLLTKIAFSQRRKFIKNSLSTLFNTKEIIQQGINIMSRAENLTIHQYCILANILYNKHIDK